KSGRAELDKWMSTYSEITYEVAEIKSQIEALVLENEKGNLSLEAYHKNLEEIKRLEKLLAGEKENFIDETIKKIRNENELRSLTTGLSKELLESSKSILINLAESTDNLEEQLKIYREIAAINKKLEDIKPPDIILPEKTE